MTGADGITDIALFYLRSHTGRRTCTHHIDNNYRNFCHSCHGNGFSHQRKPGAGSSGESTNACITCAHSHHAGRKFIFRLHYSTMNLMNHLDHIFHDFRSRSDGVRSHETGTCRNSTQSGSFITQEVQLILLRRSSQLAQFHTVHGSDSRIIAILENLLILGNNFLALLGETVSDEPIERSFREAQHARTHTESCDILHLQAAILLGHFRNRKSQHHTARMRFKLRVESIISDDNAPFRHFFSVKIDCFLIQSHQAVYMFTNGCYLLSRNAQSNGRMTTLDAGCEKALAEKRIPLLRQDAAQNFTAGLYALPLLAAHLPDKITFCFHFICLLAEMKKGIKYMW